MHTKTIRILLILVFAFVCFGAAFAVGYFRGFSKAKYDDTVVGLGTYLSLNKFQQQGDTNRVADRIRFMIFGYSEYYDAHFSQEPVPYPKFPAVLAEARTIASQERTQLVSVDSVLQRISDELRTNRGPAKAQERAPTDP